MFESLIPLLANPYLVVLLGMIAVFGILSEIHHPGATFPGIIGLIAGALAVYGALMLPISFVGVGLIALSIALFLIELYTPSHGALTIGGTVSLLAGLMMLFRAEPGAPQISLAFALPITLCVAGFFGWVLAAGLKAQRRPQESGAEGFIGRAANVKQELNPTGMVFMDGTHWKAISVTGRIPEGEKVVVVGVEGISLKVKPADESSPLNLLRPPSSIDS